MASCAGAHGMMTAALAAQRACSEADATLASDANQAAAYQAAWKQQCVNRCVIGNQGSREYTIRPCKHAAYFCPNLEANDNSFPVSAPRLLIGKVTN